MNTDPRHGPLKWRIRHSPPPPRQAHLHLSTHPLQHHDFCDGVCFVSRVPTRNTVARASLARLEMMLPLAIGRGLYYFYNLDDLTGCAYICCMMSVSGIRGHWNRAGKEQQKQIYERCKACIISDFLVGSCSCLSFDSFSNL